MHSSKYCQPVETGGMTQNRASQMSHLRGLFRVYFKLDLRSKVGLILGQLLGRLYLFRTSLRLVQLRVPIHISRKLY